MAGKRTATRSSRGKRREREAGFATRAVHAGQQPDPLTGAVTQPIYLTSTYRQPGLGAGWPYSYGRTVNPTRSALERNVAALEGGVAAHGFASGMAAISAVLHLLRAGDHVVASEKVYGGTYRLFEGLLRQYGLEFTWVDTADLAATAAAVRETTRMLYVETPSNPTLSLTDLRGTACIAERHALRLVVDNTFMTPYFQRPIELGADVVIHSTTKYLNGHSDSVGGCVVTRGPEDAERIGWIQKTVGAILSPLDAYLILRGIKTLPLRMKRHEATARAVATWLCGKRKVKHVHYPGLKDHPQRRLAGRQMQGFGGVVSFELGSLARARRFLDSLELCALAESLGGVETLVSHPASMTHPHVAPRERRRIGVTEGLVRISVGLEEPADLIADLDQALKAV